MVNDVQVWEKQKILLKKNLQLSFLHFYGEKEGQKASLAPAVCCPSS